MNREKPDIEETPGQQHLSNPDDYLNLGQDNRQQTGPSPPPDRDSEPRNQPEQPPQPQPVHSLIKETFKVELKQTIAQIPKQAVVPKQSKKIKKKEESSEGQQSFSYIKASKKASHVGRPKNHKPGSSEGSRGRPKPRRKQKIDRVEEIKREVKDLMDFRDAVTPEKVQASRKVAQYTELARPPVPQLELPWKHNRSKEQDWNSVEAELSEDSIIRRNQSSTFRKLVELVAQQGDNLLEQIAELPALLY